MKTQTSLSFPARYVGAVLVPPARDAGGTPLALLPARLRVSAFTRDGQVRLHGASSDGAGPAVFVCTARQLADLIQTGVLLPEGYALTDGLTIGQLVCLLKKGQSHD